MREAIPAYDAFQEAVAEAGSGLQARRILDLGTGTGETARRVLERHPGARLVGIDAGERMLAIARGVLGPEVELRRARLEEPLPDGPFDVVVSALAVHHLDGPGKADLFRRIAAVLAPGGRFVLGDLVVPDDPADVVTEIDGVYDMPSSTAEQLAWLRGAGLAAHVEWTHRDLAVLVAVAG
jgi:tRNA (cmo5U34)-methyltransferase